jgi:hypothetical protein
MASGSQKSPTERTRHPVAAVRELTIHLAVARRRHAAFGHSLTTCGHRALQFTPHPESTARSTRNKTAVRDRASCAPYYGRGRLLARWLCLHDRNWLRIFDRYQLGPIKKREPVAVAWTEPPQGVFSSFSSSAHFQKPSPSPSTSLVSRGDGQPLLCASTPG